MWVSTKRKAIVNYTAKLDLRSKTKQIANVSVRIQVGMKLKKSDCSILLVLSLQTEVWKLSI